MEQILELDRKIFLELNSNFHNPFLDQLMMFLTSTTAWIPLYIILLYFLTRNYKKEVWIVLLGITLTIILADQITSSIMKPFFERLRPTHEPSLAEQVHIVNKYRGGRFGFASSHAANTFGVATLIWLLLKNYRPWITLLFIWPLFVGYTRIYLGVHYPGDILAGFLIGLMCAITSYLFVVLLRNYMTRRSNPTAGG